MVSTTTKVTAGVGVSAAVALAINAMIAPSEGMVLRIEPDPVGIPTYCIGETEGGIPGKTYTPKECIDLLTKRAPQYEAKVKACLPNYGQMPVEVQASIVDIAYNVGPGVPCGNNAMHRAFLRGDLKAGCAEYSKYVYAKKIKFNGLVKRRAMEQKWCQLGIDKMEAGR